MKSGVSSNKIEKDVNDDLFSLGDNTLGGMSHSGRIMPHDEGGVLGRDIGVESYDLDEHKPSWQQNKVCARFPERRSRKPTLRYIVESSASSINDSKKRRKISTSTSVNKSPGVGSVNVIKSRVPVFSSDESFIEAIQVPFDSQAQVPVDSQVQVPVNPQVQVPVNPQVQVPVEPLKQNALIENSDTETYQDNSKHDLHTSNISKKVSCQRKHKLWTTAEVRKLIDGVSQYGVGKWADIKNLLFSSSAHRTPVDLKDKWRNLIKASCADERSKQEIQQVQDKKRRKTQPWRPLPKAILQRVRELTKIYPCPCKSKSGISMLSRSLFPRTLPED